MKRVTWIVLISLPLLLLATIGAIAALIEDACHIASDWLDPDTE